MSQPDETTLLLHDNVRAPKAATRSSNYLRNILPLCVVMLIIDMANYVAIAAQTAILEDIACRKYYSSATHRIHSLDVETQNCKIEPVQSEIALIIGWKDAIETIPGILCALPFGMLADRIGRKKVLLLGIMSCFLGDTWVRVVCWFSNTFPLRAVLFSGMWNFLGGGATTVSSILWVMVADISSPETRTSAFSLIQAMFLVSELLAVLLSAPLININPWIPFLAGSGLYLIGLCLTAFWVAENFKLVDRIQRPPEDALNGIVSEEESEEEYAGSIRVRLREGLSQLSHAAQWVRRNLNILLVLSSFFVAQLGRQAVTILLQYATKKFTWTYSQASYLISIRSLASLTVLIALPIFSSCLTGRLHISLMSKDRFCTQLSGLFLIVGSLTTFLASASPLLIIAQLVFGLGSAFNVTARSLVTGLVDQEHLGTLYSSISATAYCGVLVGGPLLAGAFSWGMRAGGMWIGLPFLVASGLFTLAVLAVSLA